MLPQKHKIQGRLAIQRVFEKGRKLRVPQVRFFSLRYLSRQVPLSFPAFSVIIPNSLKLNAVKRNRLRRRIYEAIRKNFALTKGKNYDMVIVAHHALDRIRSSEVEQAIVQLFQQLP